MVSRKNLVDDPGNTLIGKGGVVALPKQAANGGKEPLQVFHRPRTSTLLDQKRIWLPFLLLLVISSQQISENLRLETEASLGVKHPLVPLLRLRLIVVYDDLVPLDPLHQRLGP